MEKAAQPAADLADRVDEVNPTDPCQAVEKWSAIASTGANAPGTMFPGLGSLSNAGRPDLIIQRFKLGKDSRSHRGVHSAMSGELGGEPASRKVPVPLQSRYRNIERLRRISLRQAAEEAQLDHFGYARVELLQPR